VILITFLGINTESGDVVDVVNLFRLEEDQLDVTSIHVTVMEVTHDCHRGNS
jgi:hypothetical protein